MGPSPIKRFSCKPRAGRWKVHTWKPEIRMDHYCWSIDGNRADGVNRALYNRKNFRRVSCAHALRYADRYTVRLRYRRFIKIKFIAVAAVTRWLHLNARWAWGTKRPDEYRIMPERDINYIYAKRILLELYTREPRAILPLFHLLIAHQFAIAMCAVPSK